VQVRHGTPDARLLAEITLAGGFTSYEGGGISYNIPYSKNNDLEKTIYDWQYCDRLVGKYQEAGVIINREPYGPLTGTLVPPSISHVVAIVEALLAAEQGVKDITVGYGQGGHLFQDVAAIKTLETLTNKYLHRFNYRDVSVSTVLHQWMGGFPQDEAAAYGVIGVGSMTAALAGAHKVIVKSPHEALGIPTAQANANGLLTSRQIVDMMVDQKMIDNPQLQAEMDIITLETDAIMDKLFELGDQDIARGIIIGFKSGVIDVPFAPSQLNKGLILPARDHHGAIRFLEMGNLPFNDDIKAFHYNKLKERAEAENRKVDFQMVIDDIYAVGKGKMIGRKEGYLK
jgi:methylaspartate mutase epsilon subunit